MADSLRPTSVFVYLPTPPGSKPHLPNAFIEMFQRELATEPHYRGEVSQEEARTELGHHMAQSAVLVPVNSQEFSPERQALDAMLGDKQILLARDQRPNRARELWGIKLRAH
ncbi:MAG: hypothetical protein AAB413_00935 [Patescibacteria group bacterium]